MDKQRQKFLRKIQDVKSNFERKEFRKLYRVNKEEQKRHQIRAIFLEAENLNLLGEVEDNCENKNSIITFITDADTLVS